MTPFKRAKDATTHPKPAGLVSMEPKEAQRGGEVALLRGASASQATYLPVDPTYPFPGSANTISSVIQPATMYGITASNCTPTHMALYFGRAGKP